LALSDNQSQNLIYDTNLVRGQHEKKFNFENIVIYPCDENDNNNNFTKKLF
jgi:hypothetical protein